MSRVYFSIAMNRTHDTHAAATRSLSSKCCREAPLWFHGLLAREAAEDLLLKSPNSKPGLYLVRQSNNRGGRFVISVCTGEHVNHYLIETLESMFYVKRDSSQDRGQDIQARDLSHLLNCYTLNPLDSSGLQLVEALKRTTPVKTSVSLTANSDSKKNHNYIPLYADERQVLAMQDFDKSDDLQMLPFLKGEILTLLHKDNSRWFYAHNDQNHLGYIPAAFVRKLSDAERNALGYSNPLYTDSDDDVTQPFTHHTAATHMDTTAAHRQQLQFYREKFAKDEIYVSSDYITSFLRATEHLKLAKLRKSHGMMLANQNGAESPPSIRRDLKPRIHKPLPPTPQGSPLRLRRPLPHEPEQCSNPEEGYSFLTDCTTGKNPLNR